VTVFRPEVQALRAVAVASVVLYHLWPNRLTGGYVGVDVFFVISGFLITSHLTRGPERPRLRDFWARRIRRLLPAASVVLIASLVLMLLVVPEPLWQRTVTEIGASALYSQNWVLGASAVDYLAADGTPTLVQHFWSLSVEEQFYLFWPLLMLLVPMRRVMRRVVVIVVLVSSLAFSILTVGDPVSYFSTATRAWEFAAGALLALAPIALPRLVGWLGLGFIAAAVVLFTPATAFPGYAALLPVVGTVLVIAGRPRLGWRPLQWLGDHSYSIYLWHWPLIVAVPYATGHDLTTIEKLLVIVVALGLAVLTRQFVEEPVRRARRVRSYALAVVTAGAIVVASTGTWLTVQGQTDAAAATVAEASVSDACFGARAMVTAGCDAPFAVPAGFDAAFWAGDKGSLGRCNSTGTAVEACAFGDTTKPVHTIALVGNSHAGHLVAALETYGAPHGWTVLLMRKTGCTGATPQRVLDAMKQPCIDWSANVRDEILDPSNGIDAVVFASNNDADHYVVDGGLRSDDRATVTRSIAANLQQLADAGKSVVVLGDVPGSNPVPVPECVDGSSVEYDPCSIDRVSDDDDLVASAARSTPAATYVDLDRYFCDERRCHVVIGGALAYIDEHHLTASFAASLAPFLGPAIEASLSH